ncbi:Hypothetical protein NocV09_00101890 [Nannochloropsis oceanica]
MQPRPNAKVAEVYLLATSSFPAERSVTFMKDHSFAVHKSAVNGGRLVRGVHKVSPQVFVIVVIIVLVIAFQIWAIWGVD